MADSKTSEVPALVGANTKFALSLLKQLAENEKENLFMSPLSISIALAMTYLGAKGQTSEEMKSVLKFADVAEKDLHPSFSDLRQTLGNSNGKYQLHTANQLFGERSYKFLEEYLSGTKEHYAAEMASMDFINNYEGARQEINTWVEGQTKQKIKDLLPSGVLDSLTRLVLVNAIYFKADWNTKFEIEDTHDADFQVTADETIKVPMMFKNAEYNYGMDRELGVQVVELPYLEKHLSMFVILPAEKKSVDEVLGKLKAEDFNDMTKRFRMHSVKIFLHLPRFKLEQSFNMKQILSKMGLNTLFSPSEADFSGMDGTRNLYVSEVVHKAFLEVNEEGSEAAAATAAIMMMRAMPMHPEVFVNRPFLTLIRDNRTNSILFLGKVVRPTPADKPVKEEL